MDPRPGATVTFLFTDIEGSTRLWEEHPAAMPDVLAHHDALARATIAGGGGHLFKHTGDGVCAAFADAAAAIGTAVALQQALADAAWGAGPRPRVRVALDSGLAHQRDADYFGPTLNRTARVLAVGSGGQILATAATMGLAPGAAAVDLGLHRLRDLGEPVRVYQVTAPGLDGTFAPLRSLERFQHTLPVVRSTFVGRETEIARVRQLLAGTRLLTITGVGGCGKTRLALAAASQELERFTDGVFFADLSVVSDPSVVWAAVATALSMSEGAPGGAGLPPRELALGRLTDATALVVLDNCEHMLDACADVATALVDLPGTVTVLATSREPLGVEGEQVLRVPSLALPGEGADAAASEAVRLFIERATTADAAFTPTPSVMAAAIEICLRLDGIPLAIELAAARVRHLSPDEILRRLDDRFRLLTGGPRGARQRQQTLAATLDWSFQLLADRERMLLRRLAVFVDGFTLEAVEGVCAGEGIARDDVVDALGALVDKSLVSLHAAEHRYRLLETIRLYALDRLVEAGEAPAVRTRHAVWFQPAYAVQPVDQAVAPTLDLGNLRAARAWAHETRDGAGVARLTLAIFRQSYVYDPSMMEERAWGETALAYDGYAPELRAAVLAAASFRDVGAGDWTAAITHARSAVALSSEPGEGLVSGAYVAMAIALMVSDPDAADRAIDDGIAQVRRARGPVFSENALAASKVSTALMRGDPARAFAIGRSIRVQPAPLAETLGMAYALHLLGDHDGAEADAQARPVKSRTGLLEHTHHLLFALTAAAQGRWDDAAERLAAAAAFSRRYRYPFTLNDCLVVCGAMAALEGRLERACLLLAAVADRSFVRTPEMWAVYLHYRRLVRGGLDAATIHRCREEARTIDLETTLEAEVARRGAGG